VRAREHDLASAVGELMGQRDPVARGELAALAADVLAEIDHVERPIRHSR